MVKVHMNSLPTDVIDLICLRILALCNLTPVHAALTGDRGSNGIAGFLRIADFVANSKEKRGMFAQLDTIISHNQLMRTYEPQLSFYRYFFGCIRRSHTRVTPFRYRTVIYGDARACTEQKSRWQEAEIQYKLCLSLIM